MANEANRLKANLSTLSESLDDIEARLEPLLAQTLPETVVGLETMQQAKLQVVLPYLVYDLVFIYLKAKGIDPKTHPVVAELDRVRQYFDKIKNAEDTTKKRYGIDKAAAGRFIKHAIAQSKYGRPPGDNAEATPSDVRVPMRVTSKMLERTQYEKELNEMESEEEENLKMFDEAPEGDQNVDENGDESEIVELQPGKWKGKQKADDAIDDDSQAGTKRRRPRMDPFAGYGDNKDSSALQSNMPKKNKITISTKDDVSIAGPSQDNPSRNIPQFSSMASSKEGVKALRQAKKGAKAAKKAKKVGPLTGR